MPNIVKEYMMKSKHSWMYDNIPSLAIDLLNEIFNDEYERKLFYEVNTYLKVPALKLFLIKNPIQLEIKEAQAIGMVFHQFFKIEHHLTRSRKVRCGVCGVTTATIYY